MTATSSRSSRPSAAFTGVATVLLVLYLAGLALTIVGNTGSGGSALVRTIKGRLFSPWLAPAWLDLGFEHRLTWGLPDDADHLLELRPRGGTASPRRWPDALAGERAARWRRLARAVASEAESGEAPGMLAAAVGAGGFAEAGVEDVTLLVLRRRPAERGDAATGEFDQASAARVRRVAGELQLLTAEAREAVAPLVRPQAAP